MNALQPSYDVLISGLGPSGLTLAHALGQRGLSVLVLEREPAFYGNARAVYTDDECLRIFQSMGMADALAGDMLLDSVVQLVLPDGRVLFQIRDAQRIYGWSPNNFFYQPLLETTLAQGLARYPQVHVARGRELLSFAQDAAGVTVRHARTQGQQYGRTNEADTAQAQAAEAHEDVQTVRAQYLVGCDGGRSTVRTQLGIEMIGKSFPNPWLVVDIKAKNAKEGLQHLPYFNFVCDPQCPTVSCVQPHGHHRFEFMLMPGQSRASMEDPQTIRRLLARHVDPDKFDVLRSLVYTFNALMAGSWRQGRVLLAGDAAHMSPQFIGQGMNAGVRDAYNLAWKLDAVIRGQAGACLLDTYQSERAPHVAAMIRAAVDMKNFVSVAHPALAALRNGLTRLLLATPVLGEFIRSGAFIPQPVYRAGSYLGLPRRSGTAGAGKLLPQPDVRVSDGRVRKLDEVLGNGFALVGLGADPREALGDGARAFWESLSTRYIAAYRFGARPTADLVRNASEDLQVMEDASGALYRWLVQHGARAGDIVIVRPDRFVFGVVAPAQLVSAGLQLAKQMGKEISQ